MKLFSKAALAACALVTSIASVGRATVVYATNFEAPAFAAGNIVGQNAWTATTGGGNMTIQSSAVAARSGTQFAFYNTANATNAVTSKFGWKPINLSAADLAPEPILVASVFAAMASSATARSAVVGLDLYNVAGSRIAAINFSSDGAVLPLDPAGAVTVTTPVTADLGSYHRLTIAVDFSTQAVQYYFDGTLFAASTSATATDFGDADLYAIRTTNPAGSSGGYQCAWDDLSIITPAVPEPRTMALTLAAAALLTRRRR